MDGSFKITQKLPLPHDPVVLGGPERVSSVGTHFSKLGPLRTAASNAVCIVRALHNLPFDLNKKKSFVFYRCSPILFSQLPRPSMSLHAPGEKTVVSLRPACLPTKEVRVYIGRPASSPLRISPPARSGLH